MTEVHVKKIPEWILSTERVRGGRDESACFFFYLHHFCRGIIVELKEVVNMIDVLNDTGVWLIQSTRQALLSPWQQPSPRKTLKSAERERVGEKEGNYDLPLCSFAPVVE